MINVSDEEKTGLDGLADDLLLIPDGYEDENKQNILAQIGDRPSDLGVPNGYFSALKSKLMAETEVETAIKAESLSADLETGRIIPLHRRRGTWAAVAAVAAMLLLAVTFLQPTEAKCETFACLLEEYELSEQDYMLLDESDLVVLLDDDASALSVTNVDDDVILDYLIDSDMDLDEFLTDNDY